MASAGYLVELVFGAAGLIPRQHAARIVSQGFAWNYTTFLDIGFLGLAALLVWRFLRTGGPAMLAHMEHAGGHDHGRDE
jgi:hypothetical protein